MTVLNTSGSQAYLGAVFNRFTAHLASWCQGAHDDISNGTLATVRARSRFLFNNSIAQAAVNAIVRRVVGAGIEYYPGLNGADGKYLRAEALALQALWKTYSADMNTRGLSWHRFSKQILTTFLRDGECFLVKWDNPGKRISREWQLLEGDQVCDDPATDQIAEGNIVQMGIEMTPAGRPVAYHFYADGTTSSTTTFAAAQTAYRKTIRIAADRVIHYYNGARFESPRGIPLLAPVILLLSDEEEWRKAALTQAWVQTCLTAFLSSDDPNAAQAQFSAKIDSEEDQTPTANAGLDHAALSAGEMRVLSSNTKVDMVEPKAPSAQFSDFDKAIFKTISATLGISYIAFLRDFEATTYSGGRQADNEDRLTYQGFALEMDEVVLVPFWREFVAHVYDVARLLPPSAAVARDSVFIQHPQPREIDPVKEQDAYDKALDSKTISPQDVCARQGRNFHEVQDRIAEAEEYELQCRQRAIDERGRFFEAAIVEAERINKAHAGASVDWREVAGITDTSKPTAPPVPAQEPPAEPPDATPDPNAPAPDEAQAYVGAPRKSAHWWNRFSGRTDR
jgi:lambda family phage portal protein